MPAGTILIFAAADDDRALRAYARSIGLTLVHPHAYRMTAAENERAFDDDPAQGGLFSFLPVDQLRRHPHPDIGICEALAPVIRYFRPRYIAPHLIAGQVRWYTDVRPMAEQTKPYFQKLRRWVHANWRKRAEDGYHVGPGADRLLAAPGTQIAYLPPGTSIKHMPVE